MKLFAATVAAAVAFSVTGASAASYLTWNFAEDADAFYAKNGYEGTFDQVYGVGGDPFNDAADAGTLGGNIQNGVTLEAGAFDAVQDSELDPFMDSNVAGLGVCSGGFDYTGNHISDCSSGHGDATGDDNLVFPEVLALAFSRDVLLTDLLIRDADHNLVDGLIAIAWEGGIGLFQYTAGVVDLTGIGWSDIYFFTSNFVCAKEPGIVPLDGERDVRLDTGDCEQNEIYLSTLTAQVPVPAAGFLLLGGLGGLALFRRRKS